MASSRIFVKGLPPACSEDDFKKHFYFHKSSSITDIRLFSSRRIGYVGYRTPEEAQQAIRHFNKTFIRMSRISVELATPVGDAKADESHRHVQAARPVIQAVELESKRKRRRESEPEDEKDPKLKEFLEIMKPKNKRKCWKEDMGKPAVESMNTEIGTEAIAADDASEEEYEYVPNKTTRPKMDFTHEPEMTAAEREGPLPLSVSPASPQMEMVSQLPVALARTEKTTISDAEWARSRTSRLLGLLDDSETEDIRHTGRLVPEIPELEHSTLKTAPDWKPDSTAPSGGPTPPPSNEQASAESATGDRAAVRASMRLFIRNLPYDVRREDLEESFLPYGNVEEIHVSLDRKTGTGKGFAYIQFSDPDSAEQALVGQDGQFFQGRLIHILPATARRETQLDDFALSKLPLKRQHEIKRRREAASSTFNWNALYMNADAVVSTVASRLGLSKAEVLDPTSSDAAVKQAHAETHVIQETKSYFKQHGVDLDSFKGSQRGDTAILVKNIPFDCSTDELKRLFEEHGDVKKFLMPPSGIIAIVEFANAGQCKAAFGTLAYRKVKSSVLFLEKAPKHLFSANPVTEHTSEPYKPIPQVSASDLKSAGQRASDTTATATLFVRNLNFSTTTQLLADTFRPLDGFLSARVKTRTDAKKPGQTLSMGFGFLEFQTSKQAQTALCAMDGYTLEGHKLQIQASHKGADVAEERKRADADTRAAGRKAKIIIKNLPFEASKKDVRALFGAYGQLRSLRIPKKMDHATRGFAFAEFTTAKEAQNAMEALRDTHLLGRRLVLDFAAEDPENAEAEIEKMQQKVGAQVNKVALQKLTNIGRKKFTTQMENEED